MSFNNRVEDIQNILNTKVGGYYYFNWFQSGGAEVYRKSEEEFELWDVSTYGINSYLHGTYTKDTLQELVDTGWEEFI